MIVEQATAVLVRVTNDHPLIEAQVDLDRRHAKMYSNANLISRLVHHRATFMCSACFRRSSRALQLRSRTVLSSMSHWSPFSVIPILRRFHT